MAWRDEMTPFLRLLIGDDGTTETYTDAKLENAIIIAAGIVNATLTFGGDYVVDRQLQEIVPDPTIIPNRDEDFINLVTILAACFVDRGAASKGSGQAIRIRDGTSEIDLRDTFKARLANISKGWCSVYEEMKDIYIMNRGSVTSGAVILTPFGINRGFNFRGR